MCNLKEIKVGDIVIDKRDNVGYVTEVQQENLLRCFSIKYRLLSNKEYFVIGSLNQMKYHFKQVGVHTLDIKEEVNFEFKEGDSVESVEGVKGCIVKVAGDRYTNKLTVVFYCGFYNEQRTYIWLNCGKEGKMSRSFEGYKGYKNMLPIKKYFKRIGKYAFCPDSSTETKKIEKFDFDSKETHTTPDCVWHFCDSLPSDLEIAVKINEIIDVINKENNHVD